MRTTLAPAYILIVLCVGVGCFLVGDACAVKPTVSTKTCVERADVVLVGTVISSQIVRVPTQNKDGNWLPTVSRVKARFDQTLKAQVSGTFDFDCEALTFEPRQKYIFFLDVAEMDVRDGKGPLTALRLVDISSPSKLVVATPEAVERVQKLCSP